MSRAKINPDSPRLRKIRPDAVLHALPEEKQKEVCDLMALHSGPAVSKMLLGWEPPVKISSTGLYNFAAERRSGRRYAQALASRETLLAHMLMQQPRGSNERAASVADAIFLAETAANGDLEGYVKIRAIMERARQSQMDERRLAILETKAAKADKAEEAMKDQSLSMEERQARMKEVFGIA